MSEKDRRITSELMGLKDDKGLINARGVVGWARKNTKSEIHRNLQWDDKKGGEEWRVYQVRQLIAVHMVEIETNQRKLISLTVDRVPYGGYRPMDDILKSPSLTEIMLNDAMEDLQRMQRKYQNLVALKPVWEATEKVRRKLPARRKRAA